MRCSNCGKDVSFIGKVCPYCHADKSKDQMLTVIGVPLVAGGAIAGNLLGGGWGILGGMFVGGVLAAVIVGRIAAAAKK